MPTTKRAKPQRTLRVLSALTDHLIVVAVTEGKKRDEYTVSSSDGAIWVSHTNDGGRKYRVDCVAGVPTSCDCPTNPRVSVCRHIALSITLIARGDLAKPEVEHDDREIVADFDADIQQRDAWYVSGTLCHEPLRC